MDTDADPTVRFSGRAWRVKTSSGPVGPGPNMFSAANVALDLAGRLTLRVAPSQRGWTCAEVIGLGEFGYGTYHWSLVSQIQGLDAATVLGLFTWSDEAAQANRELDIEFSRWGERDHPVTGGFTVHTVAGPVGDRFPSADGNSEHTLEWSPGEVRFRSRFATGEHSWVHAGTSVPTPGGGVAPRMNLWLFRGAPPTAPQSVTIRSFSYRPADLDTPAIERLA